MKTQIAAPEPIVITTDEKRAEIKALVILNWDEFYTKEELTEDVELGYIFGKYASNQHFSKEWIMDIINEVELEKNPPIEEVVVEDVIPPETI